MIPTWLILTMAHAGPAPEGIDLDDIDRWVQGAEAFDAGPDGCWDLGGTVMLRLVYDSGASALGRALGKDQTVRGRVTARFDDHTWTTFHYTLDAPKAWWMLVRPVWGEVADGAVEAVDDQGQPLKTEIDFPASMRRRAEARRKKLEAERDPDEPVFRESTVEFVEWDETAQAVVLRAESTFEGPVTAKLSAEHRFPGGQVPATSFDATLPKAITFGVWPVVGAVQDGSIHVRGFVAGDSVLPQAQRFSAILGFLGHTAAVDSVVQFDTASRCAAVPSPAAEAAPDPPADG